MKNRLLYFGAMHLRAEVEARALATKILAAAMNYSAASCGYQRIIRDYFAEGVSPKCLLGVAVPGGEPGRTTDRSIWQ